MGNEAYLFSDGEDGEDRVMHSTTAVAAAAAVADMDVMASRDVVMNSSEDEDDRLSSMELAVEGLVTATRDENGRSMLGAQDGMAFYHVDPSRQASASPMRPSSLEQRAFKTLPAASTFRSSNSAAIDPRAIFLTNPPQSDYTDSSLVPTEIVTSQVYDASAARPVPAAAAAETEGAPPAHRSESSKSRKSQHSEDSTSVSTASSEFLHQKVTNVNPLPSLDASSSLSEANLTSTDSNNSDSKSKRPRPKSTVAVKAARAAAERSSNGQEQSVVDRQVHPRTAPASDDELLLKSTNPKTKKPTAPSPIKTSSKKASGRVIELDESDQDSVDAGEGSDRDGPETEEERRLARELKEINEKESGDDSDYDGKRPTKDKWSRKTKKDSKKGKNAKKGEPTSSKGKASTANGSEAPATKRGRPRKTAEAGVAEDSSLLATSSNQTRPTSKTYMSKGHGADAEEDDNSIPVISGPMARSVARRRAEAAAAAAAQTAAQSEGRSTTIKKSTKKAEKRYHSKEILDDEDMADDEKPDLPAEVTEAHKKAGNTDNTIPSSQEHENGEPPDADADDKPRQSAARRRSPRKPTNARPKNTYAKIRAKKSRNVVDSDDEESGDGAEKPQEAAASRVREPSPREDTTTTPSKADLERSVASSTRTSKVPTFELVVERNRSSTRRQTAVLVKDSALDVAPITMTTSASRPSNKQKLSESAQVSSPSKTSSRSTSKGKGKKRNDELDREAEDDNPEEDERKEQDGIHREELCEDEPHDELKTDTKRDESAKDAGKGTKTHVDEEKKSATEARTVLSSKDSNAAKHSAATSKAAKGETVDVKPTMLTPQTKFGSILAKHSKSLGGGIRSMGLSKRGQVPSLLKIKKTPPKKRPPLPPPPKKKPKKGEEVYSDEDQEEKNDQPEEWWDADDYLAWEDRKRKRAKARGEIDSDEERELAKKKKKKTSNGNSFLLSGPSEAPQAVTNDEEHYSD